MKQEVIKGVKNSLVINYNNNINYYRIRLILNECANRSIKKPIILILGDIESPDINSTEYLRELHYEIGKHATFINFTYLISVGTLANEYILGAKNKGTNENQLYYFNKVDELIPLINKFILFNSLVIFIGNTVDFTPVINKIKTKNNL